MPAEYLDAAIAFAREIAGEYRANRSSIAQVEDLEQAGIAWGKRQRGDWVDDRGPRPARADLDVAARRAARARVSDIRIVPLTAQFAHPVFGNTQFRLHAEKIFERAIEIVARDLARFSFEPAGLHHAAAGSHHEPQDR